MIGRFSTMQLWARLFEVANNFFSSVFDNWYVAVPPPPSPPLRPWKSCNIDIFFIDIFNTIVGFLIALL